MFFSATGVPRKKKRNRKEFVLKLAQCKFILQLTQQIKDIFSFFFFIIYFWNMKKKSYNM